MKQVVWMTFSTLFSVSTSVHLVVFAMWQYMYVMNIISSRIGVVQTVLAHVIYDKKWSPKVIMKQGFSLLCKFGILSDPSGMDDVIR